MASNSWAPALMPANSQTEQYSCKTTAVSRLVGQRFFRAGTLTENISPPGARINTRFRFSHIPRQSRENCLALSGSTSPSGAENHAVAVFPGKLNRLFDKKFRIQTRSAAVRFQIGRASCRE